MRVLNLMVFLGIHGSIRRTSTISLAPASTQSAYLLVALVLQSSCLKWDHHHTAWLLDYRSPRRSYYGILPSRRTLTAREYTLEIFTAPEETSKLTSGSILPATRPAAAQQCRYSSYPRPPRASWRPVAEPDVHWQVLEYLIIVYTVTQSGSCVGVPRMSSSTYVSFTCV
jgi:hypothetical protein